MQFGPYLNTIQVTFTVTNDDDADCFLISPAVTQQDCPPTCTNASVNYSTVLNCPDGGFFVDVDVTSLGSATSITISDNLEGQSQNITETGLYQFGPYPDYSGITFTVANDEDNDCIFTFDVQSFTVCAPENDTCINAIALNLGTDLESDAIITTNEGGTVSPELPIPSCGNMFFSVFAKDIWFTATVPASGNITIETTTSGEEGFAVVADTVIQIYSGDCTALTPIACDNDGGADFFSLVSLTGRTPGELLHIRAFGANGTQGSFAISAYDALLSNGDFENDGFVSFPNPVKDILNLSYSNTITNVSVFNLLGQEVITKLIYASQIQIDMSKLSKGTYLVKITADNQVKTIKVIKE